MSGHRRLVRAALVALALALVALLTGAGAASAAGGASITHIEAGKDGLQVLVSLPASGEPDLSGVTATVAGQDADASAESASSSQAVRRTTVLVIDTSKSMAGARFQAAVAAARTFLQAAPSDVYVGIVAFAGDVQVLQQPTQDRTAAAQVLDELTLSKQTHLYDGVTEAVKVAGTQGQRTLVVLSDGADTTGAPVTAAQKAVKASDTQVDVISLDQGSTNPALTALAQAGGGAVVPATESALKQEFAKEAAVLERQVLVTVAVPSTVTSRQAPVTVTIPTSSGDLTADAYADLTGVVTAENDAAVAPPPIPVVGTGGLPSWALYTGVGVVGLGLLLLGLALTPRKPAPPTAAERVDHYVRPQAGGPPSAQGGEPALEQAKNAAATVLRRNRGLEEKIALRLDRAGSDLKPAEWLLVHVAVFVVVSLLGLALGGLVLLVVFMALGVLLPWMYLGFRAGKRRKAFNALLPDTLQLMSGSLSAGLSLAQSIDTVVREGADPVRSAFGRVLAETRLGVDLEDALDGVAERFESKDFEWVVMAIRIQRQVGGNLGELLDNVAGTIREREYMRRQVNALAAEGKLSAYVLGGLPPLFLFYMFLTKRDYVMVMFTDPRGLIMLIGGALWLGVGIFWMSRLIKVEV